MARPAVLVGVNVHVSAVFGTPVEQLWPYYGQFDGLAKGNSAVSSTMEYGASNRQAGAPWSRGRQPATDGGCARAQIGATRVIKVSGMEGQLREYLVALDEGMPFPSLTYGERVAAHSGDAG